MIWIFDLDETLFDEQTYVISGLKAVAQFLAEDDHTRQSTFSQFMVREFSTNGRDRVFQRLKSEFPEISESIGDLVNVYRNHQPEIELFPDAKKLLFELSAETMFLVTDGSHITQRSKIRALNLELVFRETFVTDEHGLGAAKPGTKCFEMIKSICRSDWSDMVYVGDDPHKDFVNLKPLGVRTVRINRGRFKHLILDQSHEAEILINDLSELRSKLGEI